GGVCILLFFGILSFGAVELWSISTLEIGLSLLCLSWMAKQLILGVIRVQNNPLYLPATLFGLVIIFQLAFKTTSYKFATQMASSEYAAYGMLLFLTVQALANSRCSKAIIWAFTLFGFALALFAVIQSLTSTTEIYWTRTPRHGGAIFGPYVD